MSVSRDCNFFLADDEQWYMELADEEYGGLDDSTTYGPFSTLEVGQEYLDDNFSNPGGWSIDKSGKRKPPTKSSSGSKVVNPRR